MSNVFSRDGLGLESGGADLQIHARNKGLLAKFFLDAYEGPPEPQMFTSPLRWCEDATNGARMLLGAPGLTTSNTCIATRNKNRKNSYQNLLLSY